MDSILELTDRTPELEMLVDKEIWPMPTYGDLLFGIYLILPYLGENSEKC